ncbi:heparin lyase I family protein [Pseudomonas sp. TH03]|uniref:heparin lyase I family protein n=1 Tax=Pseudomonas sp. TH03 TaxID=2796369 RepID=UPI001912D861|nr:heparin lyase I family protein [Pseudomonas sp. TH03]MBK5550669.1 heparin lyase I family protein [Pseudomonas sp. TH03]
MFGLPNRSTQTDTKTLKDKVEKGKWVDWVLHVKWSSGEDGFLEIWKDGKAVWEVKAPTPI